VLEIGVQGGTQRVLRVGEEFGSQWLGGACPYQIPKSAAFDSSVLVVSEIALRALPGDIVRDAPICIVTEDPRSGFDPALESSERLASLQAVVQEMGLDPEFSGWARSSSGPDLAVSLTRPGARRGPCEPTSGFRVLAVMTTYNEADVIVPAVHALLEQDIAVHLVDNWSTDGTPELVKATFGERVKVEQFPSGGPTGFYQWGDQLDRVCEIANRSDASWTIHHDADERRHGPWPDLNLRQALFKVDAEGCNAVNHTVIEFPPVDDGFEPGSDFERYFTRFSPAEAIANRIQIKAWKGRDVELRSSGGHEVVFANRRVHPFNFLLKHYPIRSQAHGERKVLAERKPRITSQERGRWHTHYDHVRSGHVFLRNPSELLTADEDFAERWLLERLYGFPVPGAGRLPVEVRRSMSEALRRAHLLKSARSFRRWYRLAFGRHPDSGRR
jgi:glycosyltransferase involved in cell wall biosynthesis